jgi:exonuclease III
MNQLQPDIIILTETKLTSGMHYDLNKIKRDYQNYQMHHSSKPGSPTQSPSGGVITLIKNHYAHTITKAEVRPELAGHLVHTSLPFSNSCTHILGIYMSSDCANTRKKIYAYIQDLINNTQGLNHTILIGGDWNAALNPMDRSTLTSDYTTDHQHQTQCRQLPLGPLNPKTERPHTFYSYQQGELHHTSRIDDFLIHPPPSPMNWCEEICHEAGGNLDHMLLTQRIPARTLPMVPTHKPTPPQTTEQLILPIPKHLLQKIHNSIESNLNPSFHQATEEIHHLHNKCLDNLAGNYSTQNLEILRQAIPDKKDMINHLTGQLMTQLRAAMQTMLNNCPTKPPLKGHFLNRKVTKEYTHLNNKLKQLKSLRHATRLLNHDTPLLDLQTTLTNLQRTTPQTTEARNLMDSIPTNPQDFQKWKQDLEEQIHQAANKVTNITLQQKRDQKTLAAATFRANLSTRAKTIHRTIFNNNQGPCGPTIISDKIGILHTDTTGILNLLTDHMADMMAPPGHPKTGNYRPETRAPENRRGP